MWDYYKNQFFKLWEQSREIIGNPRIETLQTFQFNILRTIIKIEKRIRDRETYITALRNHIRKIKNSSERMDIPEVAQEIEYQRYVISSYKKIIHGFKTLVDSVAFTVIDKWDIKDNVGFVSQNEKGSLDWLDLKLPHYNS